MANGSAFESPSMRTFGMPSAGPLSPPSMDDVRPKRISLPDALFGWTTAGALVAFGVIFLDDAAIMGRTILALGLLAAANEGLKLRALHNRADSGYETLRFVLAVTYAGLVLLGFLFPPSAP